MLEDSNYKKEKELTKDERAAWKLYCKETAGDMDVRDSWEELPEYIQRIYLDRIFARRQQSYHVTKT